MEKRTSCVLNSSPPVVYGTGRDIFPMYEYVYIVVGVEREIVRALGSRVRVEPREGAASSIACVLVL
jgi:hypothetical protein